MKSRHQYLILSLIFLSVLLPGCNEVDPQQQIPAVSYMEIKARRVILTTELPSRVSAYTHAEVRPQVSGIIQKRLFEEGSEVREGDVLYQIDPAEYQAAYNNAQANLQRVQANETAAKLRSGRLSNLADKNAVSRQESDDANAAYDQIIAEIAAAKAALEAAGIDLRYTEVRAPISGRIGRSSVTPGALVTKNQSDALAVIQQLDPVYVDVAQSSRELLRLKRAYDDGILQASDEG
ncbi:MAG: efflux RND transporter periplasmic adaptor subunit, partial [Desulfovibrio sp.]|nr:efflux RND transporter periplasmic adaptor subunit [Desulfovibrio sp.]